MAEGIAVHGPLLRAIGVYGHDRVEPIVLASLVTGDPLLIIGSAGTGKTYLLNSLAEALGLEHRHYNASLINFDDLVGFPYPKEDGEGIRYLQTPATVWDAESVLVDEISRCKPEHQNRFFSLVHERRIQGIALPHLRYRWAAMNPCMPNQGHGNYEGSVPLDQALADRFAFVIEVPDWDGLSDGDRRLVSDPRGDGIISTDDCGLREALEAAGSRYRTLFDAFPDAYRDYATHAATLLGTAGIRLSPRRVRQLSRNLLAVAAVNGGRASDDLFRLTLSCTIPDSAWGSVPEETAVRGAHRAAWDAAFSTGTDRWLNGFVLEPSLGKRVKRLLNDCPDSDTATLAVSRTLASEPAERRAAFAFALYPVALACPGLVGNEGVNELGKLAGEIVHVEGEIEWQERVSGPRTNHPGYEGFSSALKGLRGPRRQRAQQLFNYLLVNKVPVKDPASLEKELNTCIAAIRSWRRR
jgi:MoxR-like ATPase